LVVRDILQENRYEPMITKIKQGSLSTMSDVEILRLHNKLKKEARVHSELTSAITVELVNRGWRQEDFERWTWRLPGD
jgi:hypothetical protein